jgi:hypothetical protein
VVAGLVLLPATAVGKELALKGRVAGDTNGAVSLKVVVERGKPKRLKAFAYRNLDGFCDQDDAVGYETPAGEQSRKLTGSTRADYGGAFQKWWYAQEPQRVEIFGKVRDRGRRVRGAIRIYFQQACKAEGRFTATTR